MKGNLKKLLCLMLAIAMLTMLVAGCGGGGDSKESAKPSASAGADKDKDTDKDADKDKDASSDKPLAELPRNETLYLGGQIFTPPTNFNPLSGTGTYPTSSARVPLIYETLFMYNPLDGGLEPLLGTTYEWIDDNTLQVKLNPDAKWSDGEKLTAKDVEFTYKMSQTLAIYCADTWDVCEDIKAVDDETINFVRKEGVGKMLIEREIMKVCILPEHIWAPMMETMEEAEIRQFENFDPVGSGSYKVYYYDDTRVVLIRDDNYWGQAPSMFGKLAEPKYIAHVIFKDNNANTTAMQAGEIDYNENFIPQMWKLWENGEPYHSYMDELPYYEPGMLVSLYFNLTKPGLDNPDVRRAIGYAINYPQIIELAMSGYSPDVVPSLLMPDEMEKYLIEDDELKSLRWTYDPDKANEILDGLGAKKGSDGVRVLPDGTRLGFWGLECPKGWSDWTASLEIVAQSLKAVGIDAGSELPEQSVWLNDSQTGEFDMIMQRPAAYVDPSQPYARCKFIMEGSNTPAIGEQTFENYNRYNNEEATKLVQQIAVTEDEEELKKLYTALDKIYLTDIPVVTLMYRPLTFYSVYEGVWTGFVREGDGSNLPGISCFPYASYKMLYNLKLVDK
ncbi:ABC transporter substrate-binding protein [Gehongia tenuis]|uniref:ABC transporter substrate-binding protein n=1 Tax=Gehongia tenuis TaxID=2763655 RepID=A0A926HPX5_9FIRM|nr:ABC transporter substrate-binding protein [Gehongia tenuis]MBC8530661.1 ABC transporter substrate-binding protein [Gehongia tenuis]